MKFTPDETYLLMGLLEQRQQQIGKMQETARKVLSIDAWVGEAASIDAIRRKLLLGDSE